MTRLATVLSALPLAIGIGLFTDEVHAAFFIVNSTADVPESSPGNGSCNPQGGVGSTCTLRAAIMEANALPGAHTIAVASGTYNLTRNGSGEEAASTGDLDILSDITLTNGTNNPPLIFVQASDRAFDIHPGGRLSLINISVAGGLANSANTLRGGAFHVHSGGELNLDRAVVSGNIANLGGAIYSDGDVQILDSEFFNNALLQGGFLLDEFINGTAILTRGTLSVERSSFHTNGVIPGGEGLTTADYAIHARTGGPANASVALINTTVARNTRGVRSEQVPLEIRLSTIAQNNFRGVTFLPDGNSAGQLIIRGSAIVGNSGRDCGDFFPAAWNDLQNRGNVSTDDTCGFTGQSDVQNAGYPFFDSMENYGGRTRALMPVPGSAVVDRSGECSPPEDQRGTSRPLDGDLDTFAACDAGAIEYNPDTDPFLPDELFADGFE